MSMVAAMHLVRDQRAEAQRQMRGLVLFSALGHAFLVVLAALTPGPAPLRIPPALTVDLFAALPSAPAPPAPARVIPAPAPPKPTPAVKILPKQAPVAMIKPKPKPKPVPVVERRARPKELAYEDALAQLRGEVGEVAPPSAAPPSARVLAAAPTAPARGLKVAPELLAWHLAVKRHVRANWITPPEFRASGLAAELVVDVAADGRILGRPELVGSSGNPFYDDNAVRALLKASPLPAPPEAGRRTIVFTPEE